MGCSATHPVDYTNEARNKLYDSLNSSDSMEPIVEPKQNPYMELTHKDIFHLKMSWKGLRRALDITGVNMFIKYESVPDYFNIHSVPKNLGLSY